MFSNNYFTNTNIQVVPGVKNKVGHRYAMFTCQSNCSVAKLDAMRLVTPWSPLSHSREVDRSTKLHLIQVVSHSKQLSKIQQNVLQPEVQVFSFGTRNTFINNDLLCRVKAQSCIRDCGSNVQPTGQLLLLVVPIAADCFKDDGHSHPIYHPARRPI